MWNLAGGFSANAPRAAPPGPGPSQFSGAFGIRVRATGTADYRSRERRQARCEPTGARVCDPQPPSKRNELAWRLPHCLAQVLRLTEPRSDVAAEIESPAETILTDEVSASLALAAR